jgi:hypothetical protein
LEDVAVEVKRLRSRLANEGALGLAALLAHRAAESDRERPWLALGVGWIQQLVRLFAGVAEQHAGGLAGVWKCRLDAQGGRCLPELP